MKLAEEAPSAITTKKMVLPVALPVRLENTKKLLERRQRVWRVKLESIQTGKICPTARIALMDLLAATKVDSAAPAAPENIRQKTRRLA